MINSVQIHGFTPQGLSRFEAFLQNHIDDLTTAQTVQMSAECLKVIEKAFNEGEVFPVWKMASSQDEAVRFIPRIDDLIIE